MLSYAIIDFENLDFNLITEIWPQGIVWSGTIRL